VRIPLVDLARQHRQIAETVRRGWEAVLDHGGFILGPEVAEFEAAFAAFCRVEHCVGVGNGTDALELALRALGIGPGDEVIVPANTFIATALAAVRCGASVRLVDCDPKTYLIDVAAAREAVGERTRAIIPVHLFGQMAPVEQLTGLGVPVIEDAAQAQGAERNGQRAGSVGVVGATSFYPGKNIGAYGDAGAVLTDDSALAGRVAAMRNWGSDRKYHHPQIGFNSRLDTIQAVVLSAKLERLDEWNEQRRAAARFYDQLLETEERVVRPLTLPGNLHVFHLYVVEVDERDRVLDRLHQAGIGAGVHYPIPIHLQQSMESLGYEQGAFPNTERAAERMISLPIFPGITESEQEYVVATLRSALA
jgi:dTDP-4-amino-4,6-dideoxygalactose transaminase